MIRIVRAERLAALQAEADAARSDAVTAADELEQVRAALACAEGELTVLRAQSYLDAEDRVALRTLLRTMRKQVSDRAKVAVLFRRGELLSVHKSREAAEAAAEAKGAPREGWVSAPVDVPLQPASEVAWRVSVLPVQAEQ